MSSQDMPEKGGTIKPGENLKAPEWEAYWTPPAGKLRGKRSLEEYGFANAVATVMYQRGWWTTADLPVDSELANLVRCTLREVKRLRPSLERIPDAALRAQIARMHRWPMWLHRELAP